MAKQFTGTIVTLIVKAYRLYPCSLLASHSIKSEFGLFNSYTTQAIRKYCSQIVIKDNEFDNKKTERKLQNSNEEKNQPLVSAVSTILSIDSDEALKICHHMFKFKTVTKDDVINILTIVKEAGISIPFIKDNIHLFIQNMEFLEKKLYCIKRLKDNINEMLPLLNIDMKYLNVLIVNEVHMEHNNGRNKIRYLADELGCTVYMLCELIAKEPSIMTLSINRIKTIMNVLKEYNYETKEILSNLWLFKYSPRTIRRRSSTVRLAGLHTGKPWVIRCSVNGLQRYVNTLRREAQLNSVYGCHISLLSKKLNITEEEVEFYIKRSPNILEIQLDKISEVLDIVLKYGYGAADILSCHRIFLIKATILEERLKRLQQLRGKHRLTLVYCSTKVFEDTMKIASKIYNKEISEVDDNT